MSTSSTGSTSSNHVVVTDSPVKDRPSGPFTSFSAAAAPPSSKPKAPQQAPATSSSSSKLPAKPEDAFEVYLREKKDEIKKDYAGFSKIEIQSTYKRKWVALGPEKQKPYIDKFKKEVEAYEKKVKASEAEQERKQQQQQLQQQKKAKPAGAAATSSASSANLKRSHDDSKSSVKNYALSDKSTAAAASSSASAEKHKDSKPETKKPKIADEDNKSKDTSAVVDGAKRSRAAEDNNDTPSSPEVILKHSSAPKSRKDSAESEAPAAMEVDEVETGGAEPKATAGDATASAVESKKGQSSVKKKGDITKFFKPGAGVPDFSKPADEAPTKRKFLSKAEKEHKKKEEVEQRKQKRQEEKEERERQREKAKEEERERRRMSEEAKKPKDDSELLDESTPLPSTAALVRYPLPLTHFADLVATAEFARRFSSAMATDKLQSLTFHRLQDVIFDPLKFDKLAEILAYLLITLLEVNSGEASCHVPSDFELNLCDLPLNGETASEMCRLYLKQMKYPNTEVIEALETRHFAELGPQAVVEVLAFLRDQHFHSHHICERVEFAQARMAEIQKELYHLRREVKRKEKEKTSSKEAQKKEEDLLAADAKLAAELAQR